MQKLLKYVKLKEKKSCHQLMLLFLVYFLTSQIATTGLEESRDCSHQFRMAHVVRLQNLSNSASAADVRAFFQGFQIPNGGVKIIGGEKGECFVIFTTFLDANGCLRKDGMWLNEQRISLFPSR